MYNVAEEFGKYVVLLSGKIMSTRKLWFNTYCKERQKFESLRLQQHNKWKSFP